MKTKDLFKLAVRLLGLVFLYRGLLAVPATILVVIHRDTSIGASLAGILLAAWQLLVAYWLLRGAPLLMRIAYPNTNGNSDGEQQIFGTSGKKADA